MNAAIENSQRISFSHAILARNVLDFPGGWHFPSAILEEGGGRMTCSITRAQIRSLVLGVIRADLGCGVTVREISRLGEDLGIAPGRREGYLEPINNGVRASGFKLVLSNRTDLRHATCVRQIIDTIWSDIEKQLSE